MAEFQKLTEEQSRALRRLELFRQERRFQQLARATDRAAVRLASAIKATNRRRTRAHLSWLAEISQHESDAYRRLSHREGAIRYCEIHIEHALRKLGVGGGGS